MSNILPLALLAAATPVAPDPAETMIDVTAYGARPDSREDATVAFQKAIQAVREAKDPVTLVIPKGRYDFFSTHATRRACYYSNATERDSDAIRKIAIDLSDCKALTVEGNGSELVMRGAMTMLVAERCQDLTLRNLKFDFARPTVSEITAVEKGDGYWIGKVHPDSTYRIEGGRIEWFGEDWSGVHNLVQHCDPATESVWRGSDPTASATSVIDTIGRRIRFAVPPATLDQVVVGRTYQFRDTRRSETGMWFNRSRNVSLSDLHIRSMAGFGVLFQYTENIDLRRIRVAPVDASGRTCASAADILHFSGCRGKIVVAKSILTAAHDDAINIHGTHLQV
ncbi:right-handed parallel beta-helix repeat-containing protein, partial [bacterium]